MRNEIPLVPMRRVDKRINSRDEIEKILMSEKICRIGLTDGKVPYIVPVNYGYHDGALYIHSAVKGRKIEMIKNNNIVCFEIESGIEITQAEEACKWDTFYTSIIGYGRAEVILDPDMVKRGLNILMKQQSGKDMWNYDENRLKKTAIIRIKIESVEGKKNG